jgi:hypothetical protein
LAIVLAILGVIAGLIFSGGVGQGPISGLSGAGIAGGGFLGGLVLLVVNILGGYLGGKLGGPSERQTRETSSRVR